MPDIIQLLPDSVANQIAAGEVIQRPASVVKELMENAVDSGADEIKLIIKDAGKSLVQVIDNGCAMSTTDARMSFERHATSKIKKAEDLFAIHTLGFRGEALASIAAIARVELRTHRMEDETGTQIYIEGSNVINQDIYAGTEGTSIAVKNLFYNIPARRKFLKSNTTELRHIIEEFERIALVKPEIRFVFTNDDRQLFNLPKGNLKQRIVALFGNSYNTRLIPMEQASDVVSISGFIGKPEFSRKTRGEQYFFVNGRFIKHPYLNHAVDSAFRELIPTDAFPTYFIYFKIDPKEIDINIHPTKTEVNFQNNNVIYAMLSSTIKQALGKFNITPSLDFEMGAGPDISLPPQNKSFDTPAVKVNPHYNPFVQNGPGASNHPDQLPKKNRDNWQELYNIPEIAIKNDRTGLGTNNEIPDLEQKAEDRVEAVFQLLDRFLISRVRSGLMIIDRQRAMERILFEENLANLNEGRGFSQQSLFPETLHFSTAEAEILMSIMEDLNLLGFDVERFSDKAFVVKGVPAELNNMDSKDVLESIIDNVKKNLNEIKIDKKVFLARSMAANMAGRNKKKLEPEEIKSLIDRLFSTKFPEVAPDGKPIVKMITFEELEQKF
ncbi:MAG: DNA mismatch repair endonuclease MutL [Bacteroidales bacterium]|nr:DNA mismatch repair endonuclease MutL [Bacteroidales bacterium]MCF8404354.1 DNA mismatch repair endonuclease MutL [Bacteroidales bacterium]